MDINSILRMMSTPIGIGIVMLMLLFKDNDRGFSYRDILPLFLLITVIITVPILIINIIHFYNIGGR